MVITNRELPAGTVLQARFKKQEHSCTVEFDGEGKRSYLIGEKRFSSPSAAASSITGGAINGWAFWSVQGEAPAKPAKAKKAKDARSEEVADIDQLLRAAEKPKKARTKKFKLFERLPDEDGQPKFWCHGCQASFVSETDQPEACPNGHWADDAELTAAPAPEAEMEAVEA